jgi:hypothetical protein
VLHQGAIRSDSRMEVAMLLGTKKKRIPVSK